MVAIYVPLLIFVVTRCYGVGDVCMTNFECSGGQSCVSGICRCANNQLIANGRCIPNNGLCNNGDQVYFDGKCYKSVEIGDPCVISYQCQGGSSCFNGTCICPTGSNSSNGRCIQANGNCSDNQILIQDRCYTLAQIGQYCTISAQCLGGSLCTNYQCKCPEGTAQNGEVCRPAVSPVTCPNGQVSMNGMCVQRVAPGQPCQGNAQCLDGSSCVNSYCICPEGMNNINGYCRKLSFTDHCNEAISIELNGRCASVQKPGGYCQRSEQCLGGSICTNGYCSCPSTSTLFNGYCVHSGKCPENQVDSNGRCYQRSYIGGYCMISEQCMGGSECTYAALCQCPYGTQEVDGNCRRIKGTNICLDEEVLVNDTCVERVIPGHNCNHTEQCLGDSSCLNSVCVCPPGTQLLESYCVPLKRSLLCNETEMELNGECLKYARPGHNCTDNLQCLASSTCPTGVCECSYGYTNVMGYCIIIGIGRAPRECRNSEILINDHCFNKAYIGQYCIYTEQCQGGSSCTNSYCACASGSTIQGSRCLTDTNSCEVNQVKVNGQCYNTSEIGQQCQIAPQCLGGSICGSNICVCPQGTHQESAMCVRDANTCSAEQVSINGQCYKKAQIGEFCIYSEQCEGGSKCTQSRCTCPQGTVNANGQCTPNANCKPYQVLVNGLCLDSVSIGMKCSENSQCIGSASCTLVSQQGGSTCQCKAGTVFIGSGCVEVTTSTCPPSTVLIPENGNCLSLVQVGQFCTYSSQCMGFSACIGQFCGCPTGFTNINNICRHQQTNATCDSSHVAVNGLCFPRVEPNAYCAYSQQCTGGSTCVQNYCTCPLGTALSHGICQNTGRTASTFGEQHEQPKK